MGKITGKDIKAALHTSLPIIVTFLVLGAGYGILMQTHGLPELIALAVVAVSYIWKRNTIFSVVIGTALYMFLVQSVF